MTQPATDTQIAGWDSLLYSLNPLTSKEWHISALLARIRADGDKRNLLEIDVDGWKARAEAAEAKSLEYEGYKLNFDEVIKQRDIAEANLAEAEARVSELQTWYDEAKNRLAHSARGARELEAHKARLEEALVMCAIPLEALRAAVVWELAPEVKSEIERAIMSTRAALSAPGAQAGALWAALMAEHEAVDAWRDSLDGAKAFAYHNRIAEAFIAVEAALKGEPK